MFVGFGKQTFSFLQNLAENNNRDWFQAHKQEYLDHVQAPAVFFVTEMGERLRSISPGIQFDTRTNGAGSLMRIYRDIRFSKDKTPYKTRLGIVFWEGSRKKMECPGYYVHIDTTGAKIYGGMHMFPKHFLPLFRNAVDGAKAGPALGKAIEAVERKGEYQVEGERYKRIPTGFDAEHARGHLLKYKGMYVESPNIPLRVLRSTELLDVCYEHCEAMAPLHHWLASVDE